MKRCLTTLGLGLLAGLSAGCIFVADHRFDSEVEWCAECGEFVETDRWEAKGCDADCEVDGTSCGRD